VIAALAALVTACAVATPLYQRALDQASTQVQLDHAADGATTLELSSVGILPTIYTGEGKPIPALSARQLEHLLPRSLRPSFRTPIASRSLQVTMPAGTARPTTGSLAWREGGCDHVELVSGRCPAAAGEILVSRADADNFGWTEGTTLPTIEVIPRDALDQAVPTTVLTVTGVYAAPTSAYWDGWHLTGLSATSPDRGVVLHDTWITASATYGPASTWRNPSDQVDLPLDRAHTGVDQLLRIGPAVQTVLDEQRSRPTTSAIVSARSGIPAVARQVRDARDQSRLTIPALMVPLGVLGLVVLWMALGAAVEQRRPEVAVARLRGQGVRGAHAHLLRQLVPLVLAGVPLGLGIAVAASWATRRLLLPGHVPFELRGPVWMALLVAVLAVTTTTVLVSAGLSREPIVALLRRVPVRRSGWGLGTIDAVVVTGAACILGVFATGRLTGPVALAAPAVLALAVGLVLARLLVPVATGVGRRLLGRGSAATGVALLQLARRPGGRATVALLTVSAAILVFAADVVVVGARNRELAASQEVGAPMVATLSGGTVRAAQEALSDVDPHGTRTTAVVVQHPLSTADQTNLFVHPDSFLRVASFADRGAARAALGHLGVAPVEPIKVVGTGLSVTVATDNFYEESHREVDLDVLLLGHDGVPRSVPLGRLASGTTGTTPATTYAAPVDCADGCILTGWKVETDPGNSGSGRILIGPVSTDDGPVDLGKRSDWTPTKTEGAGIEAIDAGPASLTVFVSNAGSSALVLAHHWIPATLPTVVSGSLPPDSTGRRFTGLGPDGITRPMTAVARLPWLPAATRNATVNDLDLVLRSGMALGDQAELQVWFREQDQHVLAAVTQALAARHVQVTDVARVSRVRSLLDESAATWSTRLGVLVGLACLVVAALGLAIAAAASWRSRARDLAILRLNGVTARDARRTCLREQLPTVAVAVLAGAATGVLAAHYALPTLPLLPAAPPVDLVVLSTAWGAVVVLTVLTALVLGGVGVVVADAVFRRATMDRIGGGG